MESLKIKVDVKKRTTENINLQQGYTYPIELAIYDNGKEYDCSGATPQIHFAKSNGKFTIKTKDITISGNKVSFILDSEATNKSGTGKLQAVLNKDGFTFGSWAIFCNIFENVIQDGATEDENIIDVLGELKEDINKAEPLAKSLETNIPKAESLSSSLTTQIPEATALVDEMKAAIEEGGTVDRRELGDFLEGFDGTTHLSLNERINYDVDYLQQQINNSSLLPYEGTSIKADNSYYGLSKDMIVKGRTLQNLCKYPAVYKEGCYTKPLDTIYTTAEQTSIYGVERFKPNTEYTIIVDILNNTCTTGYFIVNNNELLKSIFGSNFSLTFDFSKSNYLGLHIYKATTMSDFTDRDTVLRSYLHNMSQGETLTYRVIILEGDHTNTPIEELPYGEGIYSVGENEVTEDGKYKISGKSYGKNLVTGLTKTNRDILKIDLARPIKNGESFQFGFVPEGLTFTHFSLYCENSKTGVSDYHAADANGLSGILTARNDYDYIKIYCKHDPEPENLKDLMVAITPTLLPYEPYQESTYEYILEEPLRSLPNGVADTIEGNKVIRRVGKVVLDGSETWSIYDDSLTNTIRFMLVIDNLRKGYPYDLIMCDKFVSKYDESNFDSEAIWRGNSISAIYIVISKIKLQSQDLDGFKQWLSQNPTTIYYELAEPIIEELDETLQLKTFEGTTHITSDNYLLPITSTKIPSDVNLVVQNLRTENEALSSELNEAVEVLNNTDTDIIAMSWETDFRVCELEWIVYDNLQIETYNTKDTKKNQGRILTRYDQAKIIIESGKYNKPTMERQLKAYYDRGYLSEEEFEELISLM